MIEADEFLNASKAYTNYIKEFGFTSTDRDAGRKVLEDLGVTGDVYDQVHDDAPNEHAAAGFLFGMTFGLWLAREKRGR